VGSLALKRILQISFVVIGLAAVWFAGSYLYRLTDFSAPISDGPVKTIQFTVNKGETTTSIADRLHDEGLIQNSFIFRIMVQLKGADANFEAGEFELRSNMTTDELIAALSHAQAVSTQITIPEGLRSEQIAELLAEQGMVNKDEFMQLVKEGNFDYDFLKDRPEGSTLEGYLFPDTYFVPNSYGAKEIINMMLDNFDKKFTSDMRQQLIQRGLNIHAVATMASVVEREVHVPEERATVAGVFYNRLEAGMPLQSDPTVQYAVGQSPDWWPKDLTQDNLNTESPYNTYLHTGLPPAPICNAGIAALQAAVSPEENDYLYFVAKGDGSHVFAKTLEEHNANVQQYQQQP
jgi:UPF0755 protein